MATDDSGSWTAHPGEFLAEELAARGISQAELARRTGRSAQLINDIIRGKRQITEEVALDLEQALGAPAEFWLRLELEHRLRLARQRRQQAAAAG
ncbi:HigA family addiction module antitoxin [Tepidiforma flava]|uniref:HigA family addiction module antitoxin n=1 Tax=Tepidiforma flava TaxID=3004094 RepID=A0ABY7MDM7_9CHLR|nr:HigA family addiction module antitoxin [Tepidiforma flava]WBL37308.1 HigA family addiction module antitoxin [Tepidiforma flava]